MRTFTHINEFGGEAFRLLPSLILTNECTTIWAPDSNRIKDSGSAIEAAGIARLVKERKGLRVMARQEWLDSEENRWKLYRENASRAGREVDDGLGRWSDFDDDLHGMYTADKTRPRAERRVIAAEREKGWDWAEGEIEKGIRGSGFFKRATMHLDACHLPEGLLDRAKQAKTRNPASDMGVRQVLRDVRNHEDALAASQADITAEPGQYPGAIPSIMQRPSTMLKGRQVSRERVEEMLHCVGSLAQIRDVEDLLATEKSWGTIRRGASELLCERDLGFEPFEQTLLAHVLSELEIERMGVLDWVGVGMATVATLADPTFVGGPATFGPMVVKATVDYVQNKECSAPGSLDTSLSHAAGLIEIAACHA